jgi:MFS family permease
VGTLLVARTFEAWRGRALSVANLGSTLAAGALPPVAAALIAVFDWRVGLQITAAVVLVVVAPLALLVRWTVGPRERVVRSRRRRLSGRAVLARAVARARRFPWRDGGLVLLVALSAAPMITTAAVFHATSLLGAGGLGVGAAAAAISVHAVSGALGALTSGAIVDRVGVRASLLLMNGLLAAGVLILLIPLPAAAFAAFAVLGVASGANGTASGAAWAHTFGVSRLGELQGVGDAARIGGAAIGPLPLAVALSLTGGYAAGLIAFAAIGAACALTALRLRPPRGETAVA